MYDINTITQGTDFTLRVRAKRLGYNNYVKVSFEEIANIQVNLVSLPNQKTPLSYSFDETGRLVIPVDGQSLDCNTYGLEITGFYNNGNWRQMIAPVVEIVHFSENENYPEVQTDEITIDLDVTLGETYVSSRAFAKTVTELEKAETAKEYTNDQVHEHNVDGSAHNDIREAIIGQRTQIENRITDLVIVKRDGTEESKAEVDSQGNKITVLNEADLGKVAGIIVNDSEEDEPIDQDGKVHLTIPQNVTDLEDSDDYATKGYTDARTIENVSATVEVGGEVKQATVTKDGADVHIDFPDLQGQQGVRGNGITSITQTTVATEDGSKNIVNIKTTDDSQGVNIEIKNGSTGRPGADRQPVEAGDVIIAHGTGNSEEQVMSQKAVTEMHKEFTNFAEGSDEIVYQLNGEIEYYNQYGYGYERSGVAQRTPVRSDTFNHVVIGPIKAVSGTPTATYYIMKGTSYTTPANNTLLKTGTINLTTSFQQFDIDLEEMVTLDSERVMVYFICSAAIKILGNNAQNIEPFGTPDKVIFTSAGVLETTWTEASNNTYSSVRPILKHVINPGINDVVENLIANSQSLAEKANEEDLQTLQGDFNDFAVDVSNEVKLDGEIEHYSQYGSHYGANKVAQYNKTYSQPYKLTSVIAGPAKGTNSYSVSYYVVLVSNSGKTNMQNGTVLKSGTVTLGTSFASIRIDLDEEVEVPVGYVIVVYFIGTSEVRILGKQGQSAYETYEGSLKVMFNGNTTAPWSIANTNSYTVVQPICLYEKKGECTNRILEEIDNAKPDIINAAEASIEAVEVQLPSKIVAVVGDTLQVFYRSIVKAVDPYAYDVVARCAKGQAFRRFFEYKPTAADVGTNTLTINVYNRKGIKVGTASTQLVTVAAPISPSSQVNVFIFGDSLTDGGKWPCEALRRLTNTNSVDSIAGKGLSNIAFCGSKTSTYNDTTVHYFGAGGWNWDRYISAGTLMYRVFVSGVTSVALNETYTNNSVTFTVKEINITEGVGSLLLSGSGAPSASGTLTKASGNGDATIAFSSYETDSPNPLWDDANNKMTFIPYVEENGEGQIDVVYVLLSWNGKSAWSNYTVDNLGQAKTFLRKLNDEYPDAKVKVLGIQMPSSQSGLGLNYGARGAYPDWYGLYVAAWTYNKALEDLCELEEFAEYCEYVDVATQFDSEYNMQGAMKKVNTRNSTTIYEHTNGVHPDTTGYYQIADVVYRNFVANYCQSE